MIVELELKDLTIPQGLLPRVLTGTVEEKVEEYKEMLEQGVEFDPIIVWKRPDGQYWIVDGVHRTEAHRRAGKSTIKAKLIELKDELEYRIKAIELNLKHGLPLQKEERILLTQALYKLGVPVAELKKLFGVAERTIYYWLEPIKEKEKEELKKKAMELRKQGLTQEEVAKQLGVSERTIYNWEREGMEEPEKIAKIAKISGSNQAQLLSPDGTPTQEGFKALSEFIEEHEEELRDKPFNDVVKEQALRDILKYLNEAVKRDFRKLIDDPNYDKVKNYLFTASPYKELSVRARRIFFEKAKTLWEGMKKEYEERKRLENLVLEKAKEILLDIDYQFSTWKSLRFELGRRGVNIFEHEEVVDEILHRNSDELISIYRQIPEADDDSLTEEELKEIAEKAKEGKDKWAREHKARKEIRQKLKAKRLRPVDSVVERFVKRVEELLKEETKPTLDLSNWEQVAEELEQSMTDEDAERLREEYEQTFGKKPQEQKKTKEKEKKEQSPPPSIEDWYRDALEELLLKMGLALGWPRAFEIAEEVLQEVKEYSKKAVRGW